MRHWHFANPSTNNVTDGCSTFFKTDGLGFAEVFLECRLETALRRNNLRSHPVSLHTMQAIFAKMELPNSLKFPWEKYHLTLKEEGELNAQTLYVLFSLFSSCFVL